MKNVQITAGSGACRHNNQKSALQVNISANNAFMRNSSCQHTDQGHGKESAGNKMLI